MMDKQRSQEAVEVLKGDVAGPRVSGKSQVSFQSHSKSTMHGLTSI